MPDDRDLEALRDFDGVARLFPLPNFVMFPHVLKPLHIFEQRYRQMTEDAINSNRLIALVLLKPGFEKEYEGQPPIHEMACLAHIVNDQRVQDGKFNILVRGLCRLKLETEVPNAKLYRSARGKPLCDPVHDDDPVIRSEIAKSALRWLHAATSILPQFQQVLNTKLPLGVLCDVLTFALPLPVEVKQQLLSELDIEARAGFLLRQLQNAPPEMLPEPRPMRIRKFPPTFSDN